MMTLETLFLKNNIFNLKYLKRSEQKKTQTFYITIRLIFSIFLKIIFLSKLLIIYASTYLEKPIRLKFKKLSIFKLSYKSLWIFNSMIRKLCTLLFWCRSLGITEEVIS